MKLIHFEVIGLLGRNEPLQITFNTDINVLTGRNGSGKTSSMKLLWYIVSGNILQALREVSFRKATLTTTDYKCAVTRRGPLTCRVDWEADGRTETFEDIDDGNGEILFNAEDEANRLLVERGSSVFFPTFRRIEGGFTLNERNRNVLARTGGDIEASLVDLSKKLSRGKHVFVSALSTLDIVSLLQRQYTDLSEEYNKLQQHTSQLVISRIKGVKKTTTDAAQLDETTKVLDQIQKQIEEMEIKREAIMKPLEAVRSLAMTLFKHSGISLGKYLNFGDAANAVSSETLSAGEKQMLSFIAYNAFYKDALIVIDEPELSLHVDWQRQLFPILMAQHSTNQFVVATHSPFIYSKYPDKEVVLDPRRGDEEQ